MIPQANSKLSKYLALDKNLYNFKKTVENYLEGYLIGHDVPEDIWQDVIEVQYRAYTETRNEKKEEEEAKYAAYKRRRSAICTFLKGI